MAFIRLVAALIGFVFGFFLGASLLQVTQVTPPTNQIYVVLLLATACAILGWLGAPYVTVVPAKYVVNSLREASAGNLIGGVHEGWAVANTTLSHERGTSEDGHRIGPLRLLSRFGLTKWRSVPFCRAWEAPYVAAFGRSGGLTVCRVDASALPGGLKSATARIRIDAGAAPWLR